MIIVYLNVKIVLMEILYIVSLIMEIILLQKIIVLINVNILKVRYKNVQEIVMVIIIEVDVNGCVLILEIKIDFNLFFYYK